MTVRFVRLASIYRAVCGGAVIAALAICMMPSPARAQQPAAAPAKATLHGLVTGQGGAPQIGASVTIAALGAVAITDEKGEYTLLVPPGTYVVRVEAPGAFAVEKTVTATDAAVVTDFQVAEDQLGEAITIFGSRTPRSRLETWAPVDVITSEVITESSHTEMNQILN